MAEFEELKLSVSLVDNASAGLDKIRTQLTQLQQTAGQTSTALFQVAASTQQFGNAVAGATPHVRTADQGLKGLTKSAEETTRGLLQMALAARGGAGSLPQLALGLREASTGFAALKTGVMALSPELAPLVIGLGAAAIGITAVGAVAAAVGVTVFKFGQEMNRLSVAAKGLGVGFADLKNMADFGARFGKTSEEVIQGVAGMQKAMTDLSENNSQLRQHLLAEGIDAGFIDLIKKQSDPRIIQNLIRERGLAIRDARLREGKSMMAATGEAGKFVEEFGQNRSILAEGPVPELDPARKAQLETINQESTTLAHTWADIKASISDISLDFMTLALPAINVGLDAIWLIFKGIHMTITAIKAAWESIKFAGNFLTGQWGDAGKNLKQIKDLANSELPGEKANATREAIAATGGAGAAVRDYTARPPGMAAPAAVPPAALLEKLGGGTVAANDNVHPAFQQAIINSEQITDKNTSETAKLTAQLERLNNNLEGLTGGVPGISGSGSYGLGQGGYTGGNVPGVGTGYGLGKGPAGPGSGPGAAPAVPGIPGGNVAPAPGGGAGAAGGDLSKEAYDKMFKGTPLEGKYDKVVETAKANNVPPSLMAGIMAHETGKGTSAMLRDKNNPAGLMDPATGSKTGMSFPNVDAGIEAAGKSIAKNYAAGGSTIEGMAKSYAPVGAANDPRGQNASWPSGVANLQKQLAQPDTGGGGGDAGGAPGQGPGLGAKAALEFARQHLGEDEIRDRGRLQSFFASKGIKVDPAVTSWCADFVNANLASAGIKGTGSPAAGSFTKYGTGITADQVRAGDIGVVRGISPRTGQEGTHVGQLTGNTRMGPRGLEVEMLGGNQGGTVSGKGGVSLQWRLASSLHLRRPPEPTQQPNREYAKGNVSLGDPGAGVPVSPDVTVGGRARPEPDITVGGRSREPDRGVIDLDKGRNAIDAANGNGAGTVKHEGDLRVRVEGPGKVSYNGTGLLRPTEFERSVEGQLTNSGPRVSDDYRDVA